MAKSTDAKVTTRIPRERSHFRALLLANPNYFGNVKGSAAKAVTKAPTSPNYETIGCVGFQPQFNRLDAVVFVRQPVGYGGDVCSPGTPEYVRFYLSFDNGATWQDQGITSFTAYDIPGTSPARRLEYAVTLDIKPPKKSCLHEVVVLCRAILSWNQPPPPNDPSFPPVWGHVHDTHIQIEPRKDFVIAEVLQDLKVKFTAELGDVINLDQPVEPAAAKALTALELKELYKGKKVEPHRFALAEIAKHLQLPTLTSAASAAFVGPQAPSPLAGLGLDIDDILAAVVDTGDGNTNYEQLECVGLNPNQDALVGIIRVKLPFGFSGGLCTAGSREFVTFWGDFDNNGTFETCLGTTSVNVHDVSEFPRGGLEYSVFLPVNLDRYRRPCQKGPRLVKIRAILSWQVPPDCASPNKRPIWGNREETTIHIRPGRANIPGTHYPFIETVGGMDVADVNAGSGLANGPAVTAGFTAIDSPFGGEIILTGHLGNTTDISGGATALRYRVFVSPDFGATWQPVTNSLTQKRSQLLNGIWSNLSDVVVNVEPGNWYRYLEDLVGGPGNAQIFVKGNVLARWEAQSASGVWLVKIEAMDPALPATIYTSNIVRVAVDNTAPNVAISITSGGGNCADFQIGDVIEGKYTATDSHFLQASLTVQPGLGGLFTAPLPMPTYPTSPTGVVNDTWRLDTSGMPRCGYVVFIHAWDRTIYNSGVVGLYNNAPVGFCLKP